MQSKIMENKKIILLTNSVTTEALIKECLSTNYTILTATIDEIDQRIENNKDVLLVLADISNDDVNYFKSYVFLHLKYDFLQIIAITQADVYARAVELDKAATFWLFNPDNTAELIAKMEQLKKYRVSSLSKIRLLETVFEQTSIGFAVLPTNRNFDAFINQNFTEIIGYSKEEYLALGWNKITFPDDAYIDQYIQRRVDEGQGHATIKKRIIRKDGQVCWIEQSLDIVNRHEDGNYIRVVMIRDITESQELEKKLTELNRSQETMFRNLPGLVYRCLDDEDYTMLFISEGSLALTGYSPEELVNHPVITYNEMVVPKYRKKLRDVWNKAVLERTNVVEIYQIKMKNGEKKWVIERGVPVYDEHGDVRALEGVVFDISRSKGLEEQIRFYNEYEQRFHLPNRSQLTKKIQAAIDSKSPKGTILLINLKDTQKLYRSQGYEYSELLSSSLVNKLKTLQCKKMVLYYVEEDIYVFYASVKLKHEEIIAFYSLIKDAIIKTITREQIHCYIGVRHLSKQSIASEICLQNARIASEFIRDEDKIIGIAHFNEEMEALIKREDTIKRELFDLSYSPDFGALRLVFQPIVSMKSGKTIAFEALARYTSPIYGVITPSEFIPIVEKNWMIVPFGRKINELALIFTKQLLDNGINNIRVCINVSTLQLLDSGFVSSLLKVVNEYAVPPKLIVVEMTETIFSANYELLNARLDELRQLGFSISLDDFGTGFSSLSLVAKLDFDTIKIDKSFIDKLERTNVDTSIIPEIISMCQKFEIACLAEGIETKEQYIHLSKLGCDYGQGYFMSRPLESAVALNYIKAEKDKQPT